MQKSHSKNERLNFVENGTKLSEPNIDKLTRKMENFEKILTHVQKNFSVI